MRVQLYAFSLPLFTDAGVSLPRSVCRSDFSDLAAKKMKLTHLIEGISQNRNVHFVDSKKAHLTPPLK